MSENSFSEDGAAENRIASAGRVKHVVMWLEYCSLVPTTLSDYISLVDDYNVSEVEDAHIQAAARYGW